MTVMGFSVNPFLDSMNLKPYLTAAKGLAQEAGSLLLSHAQTTHKMEFKSKYDPVTDLDRQSEKIITDGLKKAFPEHGILAEEGTQVRSGSRYCWIIDPLDGTTNFAHGLPYFSVSIALAMDGKPIVGVVYAPKLQQEFYAYQGGGGFLNDTQIKVSRESDLTRSFLATGEPYNIRENLDYHVNLFKKCVDKSLGVRRFGSASLDLCYVAGGKYEGYWEAELKPWDAAAGILILQEAYGQVSDYCGQPYVLEKSKTLLATNGLIHSSLVEVLSN